MFTTKKCTSFLLSSRSALSSLLEMALHLPPAIRDTASLPTPSSTTSRRFSYRSVGTSRGGFGLPNLRLDPFPLAVRRVWISQRYSVGTLHVIASSDEKPGSSKSQVVPLRSVSVILLAGGKGKRMGANMPKQYLPLLGQPIALYSFHTFSIIEEVNEIIVVCDPSYRDIFKEAGKGWLTVNLKFALPGKERQDSVLSGLKEISGDAKLACVHDSARPLVTIKDIQKVIADAWNHGAAVLGVPVKATIKEAGNDGFVTHTLDRRYLWEMQTPQVIEPSLLLRGFELIVKQNLGVTDDVSIVEHLKHPVFVTEGSYTNLKVTTPDDMLVAERIIHQSRVQM